MPDMSAAIGDELMKDNIKELEAKCFNLSNTVQNLLNKLAEKEMEIIHLKKMLDSMVPKDKAFKIEISDEEIIADLQLRRLKEAAMNRELSLEEAKKYDTYVKNKRLVKGDSTEAIEHKPLKQLEKEDLIKLAKINKNE